ncbi:CxxxxCH/CxxCH domain-containing protein [Anaeromyxobacter sp. PSR-1]|uniref:CxxxxCH/CxxCH domain c-type cytochrome n=1 Tax=Anaeromyxobacter sp. PSR-1 TaxID=1300915 RepID=UPI0005E2490F|nr:CxxxxCH/CxxCH domain-containing protein [Anaeromyxobacter sp. PSR-1]GAO03352.1 geobacter CxxxxCH...CXXCH motif protein [Anaeromyxobacter sp. PSR-1]
MPPRLVPHLALAAAVALSLAAGCDRARVAEGDATERCLRCHGGDGSAAPPRSARGATATTDRGVGAHRAHLAGGRIAGPVRCEACHVVPTDLAHVDGVAGVAFGEEARRGGAAPAWEPDAAGGPRCAGTYCHGATLAAGGAATAPVWTQVDGAQVGCDGCHGAPPGGAGHPQGELAGQCALCHPDTVLASGAIDVAGGHHLDGRVDVAGGACGGCHGAPPATGAHALHATVPAGASPTYGALTVLEDLSPAGGPAHAFGCGQCHPLDAARHMDGRVDVVLAPDGAPAGTLKARNAAGAGYDAASGSCAGVYCHSSGQEAPAYADAPAWTAAPGALGCAGCHGNPPAYATGGPAAADANGHLGLSTDGYEWGHFGGLPGPWHTSKHGGGWSPEEDAAPITCQSCHAETTAGAGPSGFYWLDTTGTYALPGGLLGYGCSSAACHGGAAPSGRGAVAPLRHVNGRRDVAFDARAALPELPWLPAAPDRPTRPYWVTHASPGSIVFPDPAIPDAVMEGTTLSLHLGSARYDPATKTCSSVACHLQQAQVTWGAPHTGWGTCGTCHGF